MSKALRLYDEKFPGDKKRPVIEITREQFQNLMVLFAEAACKEQKHMIVQKFLHSMDEQTLQEIRSTRLPDLD